MKRPRPVTIMFAVIAIGMTAITAYCLKHGGFTPDPPTKPKLVWAVRVWGGPDVPVEKWVCDEKPYRSNWDRWRGVWFFTPHGGREHMTDMPVTVSEEAAE